MIKIKDTDLTIDRLENLAKLVIDGWDMDCLLDYAQTALFQDYQYDIDRAVEDAEDYTLEELDNG
tara:strand:+ start:3853 stop:4047 length:195 start_codon:yes stop_codon:yes gene_type:complete